MCEPTRTHTHGCPHTRTRTRTQARARARTHARKYPSSHARTPADGGLSAEGADLLDELVAELRHIEVARSVDEELGRALG
jgi:hypothetical protein